MARDVSDDTYYVTTGGKIPVKWTAPEVLEIICFSKQRVGHSSLNRQYFTRNTLPKVMCGVLDV